MYPGETPTGMSNPLGILVCFRRYWSDDPLLDSLLQWYDRAVLAVMLPEGLLVYQCRDNDSGTIDVTPYSETFFKWDKIAHMFTRYRLLQLRVSPAECRKILTACQICVQAKIPYSYHDLMLSLVPFRNPSDPPLDKVKSLRNVQAVVLILRECLDLSENPLSVQLRTINSRTINPTGLLQIIQPYAFVFWPGKAKKA